MAVFRVERNNGYTVMSNHHLRNKELTLKAKGLLSQMLSLPENWDYTLKGLSLINREQIDAIREAVRELEKAGYIVRTRERDEKGRLRGADYVIYELPQIPKSDLPTLENPTLDMRDRDAEFARKRDTLAKADKRIAELDRIISRLYEDNVMGKLSDDRFIKMSHDYELEQSNLKSMAEVLRKELKQQEQQKTNAKAFVAAVKKYTDMQELDAAVLREFIDRIEVSHADKKSKTREITIVYNFIGAFDFTRAIEEAHNTTEKQQKTA